MKRKFKLLTSVLALAFMVGIATFGVFSATSFSVGVNVTISYTPPPLPARGTLTGYYKIGNEIKQYYSASNTINGTSETLVENKFTEGENFLTPFNIGNISFNPNGGAAEKIEIDYTVSNVHLTLEISETLPSFVTFYYQVLKVTPTITSENVVATPNANVYNLVNNSNIKITLNEGYINSRNGENIDATTSCKILIEYTGNTFIEVAPFSLSFAVNISIVDDSNTFDA